MGLFDKFKKKAPEEEQVVETAVEKSEVAEESEQKENVQPIEEEAVSKKTSETVQDDADDADRYFTIMVENAYQLEDDNGVVIVGNLHGKIKKGDKIYVLFPNNRMITSTAEEIEIGPGRRVTEAENDKVALQIFEVKKKELMPPFTIITNIVPNPDAQNAKEITNPMLLGMSMEYHNHGPELDYNNVLIYMLCHTRYVVPARLSNENPAPGKVPQMQFPSLLDPSDTSRHVLPVFTDWSALSRWNGIFDEAHPEQAAILNFQEAVKVCQGRGIVINPFGPMVISVTAEHIQQIINLESYKKEFGTGEESREKKPEPIQNASKGASAQKPQMMLGVPKPDNPEVKAVVDAIVAYAKTEADIKRIDLLLKVDLQQKKSFVCVVDCSKDQTARIGAAIEKVAGPKMKEVEKLEFFLYGSAEFVNNMVSNRSIIYQK